MNNDPVEIELPKLVLSACRKILIPIAKLMYSFNFNFRDFVEVAKLAFLDAATADIRTTGSLASKSSLSAMSGIPRKEVARLVHLLSTGSELRDLRIPASEVLNEWLTNPRYFDANSEPVPLPITEAAGPSIAEIVSKLTSNFGVERVLDELLEMGNIRQVENGRYQLTSRVYIPARKSASSIYHLERTMFTLGATMVSNMRSGEDSSRLFERAAYTYGLKPLSLPKFLHLSKSSGENFLEIMDEWLTSNEDKSKKVGGDVISGVCVFAFHENDKVFSQAEDIQ